MEQVIKQSTTLFMFIWKSRNNASRNILEVKVFLGECIKRSKWPYLIYPYTTFFLYNNTGILCVCVSVCLFVPSEIS